MVLGPTANILSILATFCLIQD